MIAEHGTASHLSQLVSKHKIVERNSQLQSRLQSQSQLKSNQHEQRTLINFQDDDGSWHLHAKLPAEVGALVAKAIDAIVLQQEQKEQKQEENVSAETSFPQRKADALAIMAEHFPATASSDEGIAQDRKSVV